MKKKATTLEERVSGRVCYTEFYVKHNSSSGSSSGTKADAPILILAHGGPACAFPLTLNSALSCTRYPVRHFLAAGYRVVFVYYRGTLGFGNEFSQGNIGITCTFESECANSQSD